MQEYKVKLKDFEGPMELLLELIEKEKLNISEISLASICDQFLEYINHFKSIQPNHLANFLVIASKLILIKSKSLLPFLELTEEEEEGIEELKEKLLEFQKIKRGAEHIKKLEAKKNIAFSGEPKMKNVRVFLYPSGLTKKHLRDIFLNVKNRLDDVYFPLKKESIEKVVSFEETLVSIKKRIIKKQEEYFHNIADKKSKINTIIAFLAVLELIKQSFLLAEQDVNFGNIKIKKI